MVPKLQWIKIKYRKEIKKIDEETAKPA